MDDARVWHCEESLWTADAEHFGAAIDDDCLMVLPGAARVMSGYEAVDAVTAEPGWSCVELSERRVVRPQDGIILIAYKARAEREGGRPYEAYCTSTYRRTGPETWRVIQHQQTLPSAVG